MKLWDRITGGGAAVSIELDKDVYVPGETVQVSANVLSKGDLKVNSVLVTLKGQEQIRYEVPVYDDDDEDEHHRRSDGRRYTGTRTETSTEETVSVEKRMPGANLSAGEEHTLEIGLRVPDNAPPTYIGPHARHTYALRVGLDVSWANDPEETVEVVVASAQYSGGGHGNQEGQEEDNWGDEQEEDGKSGWR